MTDIKITCGCNECGKNIDLLDEDFVCVSCKGKTEIAIIKCAVKHAFTHDYIWTDKEGYVGFITEADKEVYLRGVKYGFKQALFWICDYYDEIEFWEKLEDLK